MGEEDVFNGCRRTRIGEAADFTIPGAEPQYPPALRIEPTHLDISLEFDFARRTVRGRVATTVRSRSDETRTLVLQARDFADVRVCDTGGAAISHRYDGREITVVWEQPPGKGEEHVVEVEYTVVEPVSGLHFAAANDACPQAAWAAPTTRRNAPATGCPASTTRPCAQRWRST